MTWFTSKGARCPHMSFGWIAHCALSHHHRSRQRLWSAPPQRPVTLRPGRLRRRDCSNRCTKTARYPPVPGWVGECHQSLHGPGHVFALGLFFMESILCRRNAMALA